MHLLDRTDLLTRGFVGFVPLRTLDPASLDSGPAVYAVLRPDRTDPVFLSRSPAGWWKRKDPSVPLARLRSNWLDAVDLVYLGKADSLCSRIGELWASRHECGSIEGSRAAFPRPEGGVR
jgi:hypothetical protein